MAIKELAIDVAFDSFNPEKNFDLANAYYDQGQYSSAAGFYLRAADRGYKTHPLIAYTSLLRMSLCFTKQGERSATVYQNTLQALTLLPGRPEAYFLLARIHERNKEWQKAYTFAELGLRGFEELPYYGVYAPAGTPRAALDRLADALARVLALPDVKERLTTMGLSVGFMSGAQLAQREQAYTRAWSRLIKASGFVAQ